MKALCASALMILSCVYTCQAEYNFHAYSFDAAESHPKISIITSTYKGESFINNFLEDVTYATAYTKENTLQIYSSATTDFHPKISIITSLYKGEAFIKGFLEDTIRQTIFDQCELIIINANSPENEETTILPYVERFPNIIYVKLSADPGLYAVWNLGVLMARGEYCGNANVDDRMHPQLYEVFLKTIEANLDVDLVYSDYYFSGIPNERFEENAHTHIGRMPEYSHELLLRGICLPNNHPLWRRSVHEKYGLFDERFKHVGDYEFWLRMAACGSKFKKVPGVYGMFYVNPHGLSTDSAHCRIIGDEHQIINALYKQKRQ